MATYHALAPERPSIPLPEEYNRAVVPNAIRESMRLGPEKPSMPMAGLGYVIDPHDERQAKRDRELMRLGILTPRGFAMARTPTPFGSNPVRLIVKNGDRLLKVDYTHNVRTLKGNTWMAWALSGSGAGSANGFGLHSTGNATSPTASTSSTIRISGFRWAATANAKRTYMPLE